MLMRKLGKWLVLFLVICRPAFAQNRPGEIYQREWLTTDSLCKVEPEFLALPGLYQPDENALHLLRRYDEPLTVLIFLGSWCSDSKRDLPRFYTALNLASNKNFSTKLFGLDRTKKDAAGFAEAFKIEKLPTFVFLRGTRDFAANERSWQEQTQGELGRIIEETKISVEQDWVNILKQNAAWARKIEFEKQIALLGTAIALFIIK